MEFLPGRLWEPACGRGAIVDVLRAAGHQVIGSDLVDYCRPDFFSRRDFLLEPLPKGVECIVTNPPYRLAQAFVEHALEICPLAIFLLRLNFLASERRTDILENRGLARVWVFRKRLPMMHRAGWDGPRASSQFDHGWFVWDRGHRGPATLHRVSWINKEATHEGHL